MAHAAEEAAAQGILEHTVSTLAFVLGGVILGLLAFIRTKAKDDDTDGVL